MDSGTHVGQPQPFEPEQVTLILVLPRGFVIESLLQVEGLDSQNEHHCEPQKFVQRTSSAGML